MLRADGSSLFLCSQVQRKFEKTEQPWSDTVQRGWSFRLQLDAFTISSSQRTQWTEQPEHLRTRYVLLDKQEFSSDIRPQRQQELPEYGLICGTEKIRESVLTWSWLDYLISACLNRTFRPQTHYSSLIPFFNQIQYGLWFPEMQNSN